MARYLSGIQASGIHHIGNYIGAILQWKELLKNANSEDQFFFMIADLHSLTTQENAIKLKEDVNNCIASYVASGLIESHKNVYIFRQSQIPAHAELSWILSTVTPLGQLFRMTQYKDKKNSNDDSTNAGLLFYPILMAADILLYNPDFVPVGEDQTQHIELTRDIAQKFNHKFGNSFNVPKIKISEGRRIMSLSDGAKKMSKSIGDSIGRININDSDDHIIKKIKSAKTDSIKGIYYDKENRPEISNLIQIYSSFAEIGIEEVSNKYLESNTATFKEDLANILLQKLSPIRKMFEEVRKDQDLIIRSLTKSHDFVSTEANKTLQLIKNKIGL